MALVICVSYRSIWLQNLNHANTADCQLRSKSRLPTSLYYLWLLFVIVEERKKNLIFSRCSQHLDHQSISPHVHGSLSLTPVWATLPILYQSSPNRLCVMPITILYSKLFCITKKRHIRNITVRTIWRWWPYEKISNIMHITTKIVFPRRTSTSKTLLLLGWM